MIIKYFLLELFAFSHELRHIKLPSFLIRWFNLTVFEKVFFGGTPTFLLACTVLPWLRCQKSCQVYFNVTFKSEVNRTRFYTGNFYILQKVKLLFNLTLIFASHFLINKWYINTICRMMGLKRQEWILDTMTTITSKHLPGNSLNGLTAAILVVSEKLRNL